MEKKATFGAGCFWGVEAAFRRTQGVTGTEGRLRRRRRRRTRPTSRCVRTRPATPRSSRSPTTPSRCRTSSCSTLFWLEHDPTQLNRQGPDVGSQYRSVIFVHDEEQRAAAEASRDAVQARFTRPVVTQIEDAPPFWEAEDYHQQYLEKRGLSSCTPRLAVVS